MLVLIVAEGIRKQGSHRDVYGLAQKIYPRSVGRLASSFGRTRNDAEDELAAVEFFARFAD